MGLQSHHSSLWSRSQKPIAFGLVGALLLAFSLLATARIVLQDVADPPFEKLASGNPEERAEAQAAFLPWIAADPGAAREILLEKYLAEDDPELRVRLFRLVERAYFPPSHGYLGIVMRVSGFIDPQLGPRGKPGVDVIEVVPDSQAEKYGLKPGDRIFGVNSWRAKLRQPTIRRFDEMPTDPFRDQIRSYLPGTKVTLHLERGGKEIELPFVLGTFPTPGEITRAEGQRRGVAEREEVEQVRQFEAWMRKQMSLVKVFPDVPTD